MLNMPRNRENWAKVTPVDVIYLRWEFLPVSYYHHFSYIETKNYSKLYFYFLLKALLLLFAILSMKLCALINVKFVK